MKRSQTAERSYRDAITYRNNIHTALLWLLVINAFLSRMHVQVMRSRRSVWHIDMSSSHVCAYVSHAYAKMHKGNAYSVFLQ